MAIMEKQEFENKIREKAEEMAERYCKHDDSDIQKEGYQASKIGFIGGAKFAFKLLTDYGDFDNHVNPEEDTTSEKVKTYIAENCDVAESFPLQREFHVCSWATARKAAKMAEEEMKQNMVKAFMDFRTKHVVQIANNTEEYLDKFIKMITS